jgi:fucose 4-O-acetylase-like acetyltransferase
LTASRSWLDRGVAYLGVPRIGVDPGRVLGIDALRGFTILLVVLGHSISNAENLLLASRYNLEYYVSNFLYTFHMPLFFLVSGYVLFRRRIKVGDRAIRLLIPFFAWIPVYWFVNRYIHHYPFLVRFGTTLKDTILKPGIGLWFLPTLLLCSLLLIPVIHLEKVRSWMGEAYLGLIFVAVNLLPFDELGAMQVKYFFFFFAAGYLLAKHRARIEQVGRERAALALALLSATFIVLFTVLYYYGLIKPYTFPISLVDLFKTPSAYLLRYLMACLGILFSISLIRALRTTRALKVFAWVGLVTMDIYVAHGLMIQLAFGGGWIKVLTGFVLGIVLSLALSFLFLRQWWVTATVFLGIKRKKPAPGVETSNKTAEGF